LLGVSSNFDLAVDFRAEATRFFHRELTCLKVMFCGLCWVLIIFRGSAHYPVDEIVIHCAATVPDWMRGQPLTAKRKEIDRRQREERGWRKIGYT
jgi:hypothetical protein